MSSTTPLPVTPPRAHRRGSEVRDLEAGVAAEANPNRGPAINATPVATALSATETNPFLQSGVRDRILMLSSRRPKNQAKERRDRVETALEPLCDTAPFVLMCTGDPESAVVVPVAIGENADAVDQWTAIQNTSRKYVSRWRSWVSPARLELVTIRIVGPHETRAKAFQGIFEPADVAARLSLLRKEASELRSYITGPTELDEDFETRCWHDTSSDRVNHSHFCDDAVDIVEGDDWYCKVQYQRDRLEEISKLELIPTWPMFLAEPSLAWGNDLLLEDWIYHSTTTIIPSRKRKVIHSVAQIEFTGFRLSEWPYGRQNVVPRPSVVGGIVTFCVIIFVARVIHGDWGVAYTAGAFFVALAGVFSTWVAGQSSNPDR
ncbi:uncharacterized protein LY79DRAFT_138569 [Colletotrichum navitas]|uniref:Uncharacterized protein n=1 Tax=Colletotrichum navitas TaxID=681940 RepID=A0AAD8QCZ3_9PEZI|nr:uncharacterized protein LY79DRAFT_138569 [Colletotrichum navitas]KAK1599337.1 hypothetical protein LY79DRAFT_138569 [Colletotrichum navitas]